MHKKNGSQSSRIVPFDIVWFAAVTLGGLTGAVFGTQTWIQEPLTGLGFGWVLLISLGLIMIGAFIMGDSGYRREGLALGRYVDLFCGTMIVIAASCIALKVPAFFAL